jgi:hypothetical protein
MGCSCVTRLGINPTRTTCQATAEHDFANCNIFYGIFNREQRVILEVLQQELLRVNFHSLNCAKTERAMRGSLHVHTYW